MQPALKFSLEMVDGEKLGKLAVPYVQVARWLNFLTSPHYGAQIIFAEQGREGVTIYFDACDGMYSYLNDRLNPERAPHQAESIPLALAS
ncbi:hypothetical protein H6F86_15530 [Phormidium sp. FACHB-592]|uniref:DUF1830 domain-containing protein n=1 Tax=Stenomitos frigidus AS-A4 TaxID=2933935 RepID=A0ABV0KKN7_9CYAN|nr:hypothetical protein [Phormidium sp. FACHB-592]MBD2075279.1 hypothetical protein [Phormidium sp. FACHB-592]